MPQPQARLILLGPQRNAITVAEELEAIGAFGRVALITAGWQEREDDDGNLQQAIGHRGVNLYLHRRTDEVFAEDRELFAAHRKRQDQLRLLRDLYNVRLDAYISAAKTLFHHSPHAAPLAYRTYAASTAQFAARMGVDDEEAQDHEAMLAVLRDDAVRTLRELDAHHLRLIADIHDRFEAQVRPHDRPELRRVRQEVAEVIDQCDAVAIAGGHVATLLGRMRLLDIRQQLGGKPVIAWSAGAMVLTDRVVLFHDRPPEGPGNAEVLDIGLGLAPGVVALPHATKRLALEDMPRMAMFAQRFSPALCLALDPYARARWNGESWSLDAGTWCIDESGRLASKEVADELDPNSWIEGAAGVALSVEQ
ncbi:MAG: Type 1 glutamine amidotransferase-like domain-containing protein [Deltaproteobacteria bacterium]|nr:Type 1 glutamine amidotransferase-like domain-containing protein [Deltaproteobacteria bacterium]